MVRAALVVASVAGGLGGAAARADSVALDLTGGVSVPLGAGGGLVLELPGRLLVGCNLGWIPKQHVELVNSTAMRFGLYDRQVGDAVAQALHHSLVVQASGGWRPFVGHGFEMMVGYTQVRTSGDITAGVALPNVAELDALSDLPLARVDTIVHAGHASVGWRWLIAGRVVIRAQIGWVHTLSSHTDIHMEVSWPDRELIDGQLADMAAYFDDEILGKYGFTPELRLNLGFRL